MKIEWKNAEYYLDSIIVDSVYYAEDTCIVGVTAMMSPSIMSINAEYGF